jgi:hypothetical protein
MCGEALLIIEPGNQLRELVAAERDDAALRRLERHLRQPRYRAALTCVVRQNQTIVGYALINHRRLRLGVVSVDAGVLAEIWLDPRWREQSAEAALLGECMGILYEQGLPLALVAGSAARFGMYGFTPFLFDTKVVLAAQNTAEHTLHQSAKPSAADTTAPLAVPALSAVGEADLEDLAPLYEAGTAHLPLAEVRTRADWHQFDLSNAVVLRDAAGRLLAYAHAAPGQDDLCEGGAVDASAARALLQALALRGSTLTLALPFEHPLTQAALQRGAVLTLRSATSDVQVSQLLAGVVDLSALLAVLAPEFERRLKRSRYAGWSGAVRLELATGRATLLAENGRVAVVDGTRPADVRLRHVTLPAVAQLLLGYRSAADLRATAELDCDDIALGLLDGLFPVLSGALTILNE